MRGAKRTVRSQLFVDVLINKTCRTINQVSPNVFCHNFSVDMNTRRSTRTLHTCKTVRARGIFCLLLQHLIGQKAFHSTEEDAKTENLEWKIDNVPQQQALS